VDRRKWRTGMAMSRMWAKSPLILSLRSAFEERSVRRVKMENAASCRSKAIDCPAFGVEIETALSPFATGEASDRPCVGRSMANREMSRRTLGEQFSASQLFANATWDFVRLLEKFALRVHQMRIGSLFAVAEAPPQQSKVFTLNNSIGPNISFTSTHTAQIGQGGRIAGGFEDCDE
jgi:hypothetical protein